MKAIFVTAVITCLFIVGQTQSPSQSCINRLTDSEVASCNTQFGGTRSDTFCRDCADRLTSYFRDCVNGTGVNEIQSCKSVCSWLEYKLKIRILVIDLRSPIAIL